MFDGIAFEEKFGWFSGNVLWSAVNLGGFFCVVCFPVSCLVCQVFFCSVVSTTSLRNETSSVGWVVLCG